jgi:hypothetical protein
VGQTSCSGAEVVVQTRADISRRERTESSPASTREWTVSQGSEGQRAFASSRARREGHIAPRGTISAQCMFYLLFCCAVRRTEKNRGGGAFCLSVFFFAGKVTLEPSRSGPLRYHEAHRHHSLPSEVVGARQQQQYPDEEESFRFAAPPYESTERVFIGYGEDDLPPPYGQGDPGVKDEPEDDKTSLTVPRVPDTGEHGPAPRKRPRSKAVVACTFCQSA